MNLNCICDAIGAGEKSGFVGKNFGIELCYFDVMAVLVIGCVVFGVTWGIASEKYQNKHGKNLE